MPTVWPRHSSLVWYQREVRSKCLTWQLIFHGAQGNDYCNKSLISLPWAVGKKPLKIMKSTKPICKSLSARWGFFCFVFIKQPVFHYFTQEWKGQPHVQKGMNHASLCITRTWSCAYFEELSNDMGKWCNALSQHCIHVVCNGVCSRPNSCDLSCLQSTLQANPGCAAQQDVLDSSPWSCWGSGPAATFSNPGSVLWNDPR